METYNKFNNHKMIKNDDLIKIIHKRLKELKLYKKKNNVVFSNKKDLYFEYHNMEDKIYINNNYKKMTLEFFIADDHFIKPIKKKQERNISFIDFYNLELIKSSYHEVRHSEQCNMLINNFEYYNVLIKKCLDYINYKYKFYKLNHDICLFEHDAELNAMMLILSDIDKGKLNVSTKALYLFNLLIAYFLLRSRGFDIVNNKLQRISIFKSPLYLLYFFNNSLYLENKIDIMEYKKLKCYIRKIHMNNKTEYDRIISGDNLSDDTINELLLITNGVIKTTNIFKHFENKELDKNNNRYVKKLLLS